MDKNTSDTSTNDAVAEKSSHWVPEGLSCAPDTSTPLDTPVDKTTVDKLMSPWVLVIVSVILIGGAGVLSALVAVGVL